MSIVERERIEKAQIAVTAKDVLIRAADLIEEFGWCQEAGARTATGTQCDPQDGRAKSFCLTGAAERALLDLTGINVRADGIRRGFPDWVAAAGSALAKVGVPGSQPEWNNDPIRTRQEVVAKLREASALL